MGVRSIERFPTGLAHFVFDVGLEVGGKVVARLTRQNQGSTFASGVSWSAQLRPLGVTLPRIIGADPNPAEGSFPYMVLERLPGVDLHYAYPRLTKLQKRRLSSRLVEIQRIAGRLRRGNGYGYGASPVAPQLRESWSALLLDQFETARIRIDTVG